MMTTVRHRKILPLLPLHVNKSPLDWIHLPLYWNYTYGGNSFLWRLTTSSVSHFPVNEAEQVFPASNTLPGLRSFKGSLRLAAPYNIMGAQIELLSLVSVCLIVIPITQSTTNQLWAQAGADDKQTDCALISPSSLLKPQDWPSPIKSIKLWWHSSITIPKWATISFMSHLPSTSSL